MQPGRRRETEPFQSIPITRLTIGLFARCAAQRWPGDWALRGGEVRQRMGAVAKMEAATVEAHRANEAKSQFLANMSHELRTPLNHVIGFSELVASEKIGELNKAKREYLGEVW